MAIKNITTSTTGLVGVIPSAIYIETDNTIAQVTTVGYLNSEVQSQGQIFSNQQIALVFTTDGGADWYQLVISGGNTSLSSVSFNYGTGAIGTVLAGNGIGIPPTFQIPSQIDVGNLRLIGNDLISINANGNINVIPNGIGSVTFLTGAAVTLNSAAALSGLTQLNVGNLQLSGNDLISTDVDGNINIVPNGIGGISFLTAGPVVLTTTAQLVGLTELVAGNIEIIANAIIALNMDGNINLAPDGLGVVNIGSSATASSEIRLFEMTGSGSNFVSFKAPNALAADTPYILPDTYPAFSGYVWSSDTSGNTSWIPQGGGGATWVSVDTGPVIMVAGTSYIAQFSGSLVNFILPATAAVGDEFQIVGNTVSGWSLSTDNGGQAIYLGDIGANLLESTQTYNAIRLVCGLADTNFIAEPSWVGNIKLDSSTTINPSLFDTSGASGRPLISSGIGADPTFQDYTLGIKAINYQTSNADYVPGAGTRAMLAELWAGGGGGGGAQGTVANSAAGGGGQGGGYASVFIPPGFVEASYTVVNGGNGSKGAAGNNAGTAAANTTFTGVNIGTLTATGGAGGAGCPAAAIPQVVSGGSGGGAGTPGGQGYVCGAATAATAIGGSGGGSVGEFSIAVTQMVSIPGQANDGNGPSSFASGGSGGSCSNTNTDASGGDGGGSVIKVTEYY